MIDMPARTRLAAALFTLALAACSHSGGSLVPPVQPAFDGSPGLTAPFGTRATSLYVVGPGRVFTFSATAKGKPAPQRTIFGSKTKLDAPSYIAYDTKHAWLWVTNCSLATTAPQSVIAFAATANGNVAPVATIGGSKTTLSSCEQGVAVDAKGNVYVADSKKNQLDVWAVSKAGNTNVAPARTITGLANPQGVAVGPKGNIFVVDAAAKVTANGCSSVGDVRVFGVAAKGAAKPLQTIGGCSTMLNAKANSAANGIALDAAGNIYVTAGGVTMNKNYVLVYPKTANGNKAPSRKITDKSPSQFAEPTQIAVDGAGFTYVGNSFDLYSVLPVLIFKPLANGANAPTTIGLPGGGTPYGTPPLGVAVH